MQRRDAARRMKTRATRRPAAMICAAATIGLFAATATSGAGASERWRIEPTPTGAVALSCGAHIGAARSRRIAPEICAVAYCGLGDDALDVGLVGWSPRGPGDQRYGVAAVDGRAIDVLFRYGRDAVVGDVWRAELGQGRQRLVERLKRGRTLVIDIAARGPAFFFDLSGSARAIDSAVQRCAGIVEPPPAADRGPEKTPEEAPAQPQADAWRFEPGRLGGRAIVCAASEAGDRPPICAVAFCDQATGAPAFGVTGPPPAAAGAALAARLTIDADDTIARLDWTYSPTLEQRLWRASPEVATPAFFDALKAGRRLNLALDGASRALSFSLAGSSAALTALETSCAIVETRRPQTIRTAYAVSSNHSRPIK